MSPRNSLWAAVAFVLCPIADHALSQTPGHWATSGPAGFSPRITVILVDDGAPNVLYVGTRSGLFSTSDFGLGAWQRNGPPLDTETITALARGEDATYAGTVRSGVFYLRDGDATWTPSESSLPWVTSLLSVGHTLYAGTRSGLYESLDRGITWDPSTLPVQAPNVSVLATYDDRLFVGTDGSGVLVSDDAGATWSRGQPPIDATSIQEVYGASPDTVFASAGVAGMFRSLDGGITWSHVTADFSGSSFGSLAWEDGILYVGTDDRGVLFTSDGGDNWQGSGAPLSSVMINDLLSVEGTVYAAAAMPNGGIYFTTDQGSTWEKGEGLPEQESMLAMSGGAGPLYAATEFSGLFRSTSGRQWYPTRPLLNANLTGLLVSTDLVAAYSDDGLWTSVDGGVVWAQSSDLQEKSVTLLVSDGVNLFAGTGVRQSRGRAHGVFQSSTRGETWIHANPPLDDKRITALHWDGRALHAGVMFEEWSDDLTFIRIPMGVYTSTNGGLDWSRGSAPIQDKIVTALLCVDGRLYAGTVDTGCFFSVDDGATWTAANPPMDVQTITTLLWHDEVLYAGTGTLRLGNDIGRKSGVFVSRNGGIDWVQSDDPMHDKHVTVLRTVDGVLYAGTQSNGLFMSDDEAVTWTQAAPPMDDKEITGLVTLNGDLFVSTDESGVYRSSDGGATWLPFSSGMGAVPVSDIAAFPDVDRLYAATSDGVYVQTLDTVPPQLLSLEINGGERFTGDRLVDLVLFAADADSLIVSESPSFENAVWQPCQVATTVLLSPGDGWKDLFIKLKDVSWNESPVIEAEIVLDTTAPLLEPHVTADPVAVGQPITVTQKASDLALKSLYLYFRRGGESWSETRKVAFEEDQALIEGPFVTSDGVDYRIVAADSAGHESVSKNGDRDFFSVPVLLDPGQAGVSPDLPSGTEVTSYRFVSFPFDLLGSLGIREGLRSLGEFDVHGDWLMWRYADNGYIPVDDEPAREGEGYFLIVRNGGRLTNEVPSRTVGTIRGVRGTVEGWALRGGDWNIIGNPYTNAIDLSQLSLRRAGQLLDETAASFQVWDYDGLGENNGWTRQDLELEPWGGLLIYVDEPDTLVFANAEDPYGNVPSKHPENRASLPAETVSSVEWRVHILGGSGGALDWGNYFGTADAADEGMDSLDWLEPPTLPGQLSVRFVREEGASTRLLAADYRPTSGAGHRWILQVAGRRGMPVSLQFEGLSEMPGHLEAVLVDRATAVGRNLRDQPRIDLLLGVGGVGNYEVLVGSADFIESGMAPGTLVPRRFVVHPNRPNPFNPATAIRYELPIAGRVSIEVFDMAGRRVLDLTGSSSSRPAGIYEEILDMHDFASGAYLVRVSLSGKQTYHDVQKIVLLK